MRVYVTNIGTSSERALKEYKTPAGAKQRMRAKLGEFSEWAAHYNRALKTEIDEVSKEVDSFNLITLPVNDRREYRMRDDHSGFTFVVEFWVEDQDG